MSFMRGDSCGHASASPRCEAPVPAARCISRSRHVLPQRRPRRHVRSQAQPHLGTTISTSHSGRRQQLDELEALLQAPSSTSLPSSSLNNNTNSVLELLRPSKFLECSPREQDETNAHFDILGIAQAMVDVAPDSSVDDELLEGLHVKKGGRRVLQSIEERSQVMQTLEDAGISFQITAGGSLANTLVAISRLSSASGAAGRKGHGTTLLPTPPPAPPLGLNVALSASCSSDLLGHFFSSQLGSAGVTLLPTQSGSDEPPPLLSASTSSGSDHIGTVFVLTSQDAQRSFLSFFTPRPLTISAQLRAAIMRCRLLVVEGYLWELPNAAETITQMLAAARAGGTQVALTAGDAGVVARNREDILKVLRDGGHNILFFANREEACALVGQEVNPSPCKSTRARAAAQQLGSLCNIAVVTDGRSGSHICCMGTVVSVPAAAVPLGVKDTCGAGDAYAAGFCFALMMGYDCWTAGSFASSVAVRIISRHGAQLSEAEALDLVGLLPDRSPRSCRNSWPVSFDSAFLMDPVGSD